MVKYLSSYIFEIRNRDIVPCATENIAVVNDNDSRILKFKIPAVIDDVDITDKILAIRYVNALGQFDTFFSDTREIKIDGDKKYIIFPWYLSQKATAASGTLTYDISVYDGHITDAAEEGQYILHTKPQVLNIEKGLLDVGSASQNPDVWTDAIATFQKIIGSYHDDAMNAAEAAKKSEDNAKASEINAESYKNAAAASEAKAKQSEQNAAISETNAADSANKAKASQTASATSEANAKISEQNAKASENASKTSADDSASSASDSANSAQDSLNSQNAAKTSETKALASEKAAKQSETNAATSEQNASNYADNSQQSADDAAASAAAALVSQNAAKASEDKAKISETNAKTSETNVANALVDTLKLSGGTMTGNITMSGNAKFVGNLTGNADTATSADSATNDSAGQQIDSTYVKNVESTDDGKLIVTKGNGDTSTADVSTPAGYNLVKTIPFAPSDNKPWLHIGDIKNTSDNDVIRFTIKGEAYLTELSEDNQNTIKYDVAICRECIINDMVQKTDTDLSSSYTCRGIAYQIFDVNVTPLLTSPAETNELEQVAFFVVPTSGGNKTSCASVWMYMENHANIEPDTVSSLTISTEVKDKNLWEYVLTYEASAPKSDSIITPFTEKKIITETDIASVSEAGIVKIGNNINIADGGRISVPKADANTSGVVKIGTGINVADDGTISVPKASATTSGIVKIGTGINVTDDGTISFEAPTASTTTKGAVKIGRNIDIDADGEISIGNYAGSSSSGGTADSVNSFTFKAQTSDPGAGSSLATGTILFVYS